MKLEALSLHHESAFLNLIHDFATGDRATLLNVFKDPDWTPAVFKKFAVQCEKDRLDWRPGPGKTSVSHYVLIDQAAICGYGRMRFPLPESDDRLGNLEFFVPPSKRGQGYGALTLNRMLFEAVRAGMARALVVCEVRNHPAIKCIEKNRGELARKSSQDEFARYWIRFR